MRSLAMQSNTDVATLAEALLSGNRRSLARAITLVETGGAAVAPLMRAIYPQTGRAMVVGITGAPGAGKSTLVNALAQHWRGQGQTVGIVAIDPTSPLSGGAILGDRIRMQPLGGDSGVFVRSMASRGRLGGLARATDDTVALLDAAGFDVVVVETVGAGQSEVDIAGTAQTTIVVETPGTGDDVQAIKAGMLEIADIFVVNKADREGADGVVRQLRMMLRLAEHSASEWEPPVLPVVATRGEGIAAVVEAVARHRAQRVTNTDQAALARADRALATLVQEAAMLRVREALGDQWQAMVAALAAREVDPYELVQQALDQLTLSNRASNT